VWPYPDPPVTGEILQPFSSAEGRFRFGLPATYETPAAANNDTKTFKWFVLNVGQFQVLYFDSHRTVDMPDVSKTILDDLGNKASSHGKLIAESELNLSGHPGREVRVRSEKGTDIYRIYLAGNRVYVVNVFISDRLSCKLDSAVKVLDTFEIVDA
jgi:hypothetical protein